MSHAGVVQGVQQCYCSQYEGASANANSWHGRWPHFQRQPSCACKRLPNGGRISPLDVLYLSVPHCRSEQVCEMISSSTALCGAHLSLFIGATRRSMCCNLCCTHLLHASGARICCPHLLHTSAARIYCTHLLNPSAATLCCTNMLHPCAAPMYCTHVLNRCAAPLCCAHVQPLMLCNHVTHINVVPICTPMLHPSMPSQCSHEQPCTAMHNARLCVATRSHAQLCIAMHCYGYACTACVSETFGNKQHIAILSN